MNPALPACPRPHVVFSAVVLLLLLARSDSHRVAGRFDVGAHLLLTQEKIDEADHHADAGRGEAVVEAEPLAQPAAHQRRRRRADVDAHVEDGERAVAARVVLPVHAPDQRRDVGLEEAIARDEKAERRVERSERGKGHQEMADGHEDAAGDDRRSQAEVPVGEEAAEERRQVDEARVPLVDRRRVGGLPPELLDQVEHEQRAHAVVAEALPHLGGEEQVEALRVAGAHQLRGGRS